MYYLFEQREVITRKPHNCWGCTEIIPIKTKVMCVTSVDAGEFVTSYWCDICDKFLRTLDYFDCENGFVYGELKFIEGYPSPRPVVTEE